MEENRENEIQRPTWDDTERLIATVLKAQSDSTMASEAIAALKKESQSKDLGLWLLAVCLGGVIAGLIATNMRHASMFYKNDSEWRHTVSETNQKWIDYLSQYDFVSQDGEGINNINTGEQGDLNNGTKGKDSEESEQSERDSSKKEEEKEIGESEGGE